MEKIVEFVGSHWELVAAFVVILLLFIANELREKLVGIPKVTPFKATDLINHHDAIILDLRDVDAFKAGHIIGAKNIPMKTLADNLKQCESFKSKPVILTCNQGQQSALAGKLFRKEGYEQVMILGGGMNAWRADSLPVVKK